MKCKRLRKDLPIFCSAIESLPLNKWITVLVLLYTQNVISWRTLFKHAIRRLWPCKYFTQKLTINVQTDWCCDVSCFSVVYAPGATANVHVRAVYGTVRARYVILLYGSLVYTTCVCTYINHRLIKLVTWSTWSVRRRRLVLEIETNLYSQDGNFIHPTAR